MNLSKTLPNKNIHCLSFILLILIVFLCQSAQANGDSQRLWIKEIQYKCDSAFPEDKVHSATLIKVGDFYSRSDIRKSIESIFSIGGFSNIEANVQEKDGGISLTFILYIQPKIRAININGNRRISQEEILEVIRLRSGYEYSESFVESDARSIKELYKLYGYMNANITFSTNLRGNEIDINFNVNEGERPIITQIIFTGTNEAVVPTRNLLRSMKDIKLGWTYKGQRVLDIDVKRIEQIYREKEYLTAKISEAKALSEPEEIKKYDGIGRHFIAEGIDENSLKYGSVTILIRIAQGKRVYIKIDGNHNISSKNIRKVVALNRMRSVSESVVRRSRDDIIKLYKTNGFYLADVKYEILRDKVWDFRKEDDTEGWNILPLDAQYKVTNGLLEIEKGKGLQLSGIAIDANIYQKAQVRMRIRSDSEKDNENMVGKLYWTTIKSEKWSQRKSRSFSSNIKYDNLLNDYEIPLYKSDSWSGIINQLRLIPVDTVVMPSVDIEWIKLTTEFTPIVFNITENRQIRIRKDIKVTTIDNKEPTLKINDIRKQMLTRKKSLFSFWILKSYFPSGILDEDIFAEDLRAIQALYKDSGWTNPLVDAERNIKAEKGEIEILVKINEGPRTFIDEVIVEGNNSDVIDPNVIFSSLNVVQNFNPKDMQVENGILRYKASAPKPYRDYDVVADRSVLSLKYADKGYLAEIEPIRQFSNDMTKAIITYKIDTGDLIKLSDDIQIIGNQRAKNSIIERELSKTLMRDKIFSFSEIEKSAQRIRDIGIFESVNPETHQISDNLYKLVFNVKERNARTINLRAGYTSLEDFQGGIEASDINFLGRAHRVNAKAQLGTQGKRVEGEYSIPKIFPGLRRSDVFGLISVYPYAQFNDKDYRETRKGGTAGLSWSFRAKNSLKVDYRYDVLEYNLYGKNEVTKIGRFESISQRDGRDNLLNPRSGSFYLLSFEYANPKLGGFETFTKLSLNTMYYKRLFGGVVLALGLRAGSAWGLGGTERVLAPELFKMRDYQTPRGYKWDIKDIGDAVLNTSMEMRIPIYKWIGIALFLDSGQVYNGIANFDINSMQSSVGMGIRFITPIGPVRLDYGYPISGNGKRDKFPVFAFGNPF
ncbi:TPA: hypothetical protein ENS27_16950 [bacterium]|nr:hypothetical protein [bacterium]